MGRWGGGRGLLPECQEDVMADNKTIILPVTGMTCANCVMTVERNLKRLDGVQNASVNLSSERATRGN